VERMEVGPGVRRECVSRPPARMRTCPLPERGTSVHCNRLMSRRVAAHRADSVQRLRPFAGSAKPGTKMVPSAGADRALYVRRLGMRSGRRKREGVMRRGQEAHREERGSSEGVARNCCHWKYRVSLRGTTILSDMAEPRPGAKWEAARPAAIFLGMGSVWREDEAGVIHGGPSPQPRGGAEAVGKRRMQGRPQRHRISCSSEHQN
jgi:hypothetical protein